MELCPKCKKSLYTIENKHICIHCNKIFDSSTYAKDQWLVALYEKYENWNMENCLKIPELIRAEYLRVFDLLKEKQIYGAFFQIKDVFELILKVPVLIVASELINKSTLSPAEEDILFKLFEKDLAIGDWETICRLMHKISKYEPINNILKANLKIYSKNYICKWRNDWIGHGALALETNTEFIKQLEEKTNILNEYFKELIDEYDKLNLIILNDVYKFQINNQMEEEFGYFIKMIEGNVYLFDAYKNAKNTTTYLNYHEGTKVEIYVKEVSEIVKNLQLNNNSRIFKKDFNDDTLLVEQDRIIKEISGTNDFLRPDFIKQHIDNFINNNSKGIMLIRMKRGMGKSTLCMALDEHSNNKLKINGCSVRAYYINDTYASKINNFTSTINDLFRQDKEGKILIRGTIPHISANDLNPKEEFSKLLDFYNKSHCEIYGNTKLVMIFDGIDEIKQYDEKTIFSFIPNYEQLNDNIYIICTCRTDEEIISSNFLTSNICNLSPTNQLIINENSEEYRQLLIQYLKKKNKNLSPDNINLILNLASNNFQNIKRMCNFLIEENYDFVSLQDANSLCKYELKSIYCKFGEKHFNKVLMILLLLASSEEPLSILQINELASQDSNSMEILFYLCAIKDLLKIDRNIKGNKFILINTDLSVYLSNEYDTEIIKLLDNLLDKLKQWVSSNTFEISEGKIYVYSNLKSISQRLNNNSNELFNDNLLMHYCSIRDKFSRKDISNIIDAIKIDNQIIYILDKIHSESKFDKLIKAITLSNQAELYDLYGFTTESEKKFIDSITIFKNRIRLTLTEKRDYLETSIKYCLLLIKLGQFSKVVEILSNIIDDMEKDKTQYLDIRSTAYCNRSIAYQHIGNLEKALVDLDKAIYLLENPKVDEIIDRCKSSMCYLNRSIVHLLNNNLPNALNDIQKSLELSDEVNEESRLNKAKALMNYANIKIKLGDDSNLFSILDEAIEILEKLKSDNLLLDEDVLIKTYNNKGLILSKDGKHIEAISWHTKAANLSENLKKQGRYYFEDELCRSYFLIATLYELDKKADDEKESYRKILSSFDFINYNSLKFSLCAWCNLYSMEKENIERNNLIEVGLNWLNKIEQINWNIDKENMEYIFSMSTIIYSFFKEQLLYVQSNEILNILLNILNKYEPTNIEYQAYCIKEIGFCSIKNNDIEHGLKMYSTSIKLWEKIKMKEELKFIDELIMVYFNRAMIYLHKKDYQSTYDDLIKALTNINYCLKNNISLQKDLYMQTISLVNSLTLRRKDLGITIR